MIELGSVVQLLVYMPYVIGAIEQWRIAFVDSSETRPLLIDHSSGDGFQMIQRSMYIFKVMDICRMLDSSDGEAIGSRGQDVEPDFKCVDYPFHIKSFLSYIC